MSYFQRSVFLFCLVPLFLTSCGSDKKDEVDWVRVQASDKSLDSVGCGFVVKSEASGDEYLALECEERANLQSYEEQRQVLREYRDRVDGLIDTENIHPSDHATLVQKSLLASAALRELSVRVSQLILVESRDKTNYEVLQAKYNIMSGSEETLVEAFGCTFSEYKISCPIPEDEKSRSSLVKTLKVYSDAALFILKNDEGLRESREVFRLKYESALALLEELT